jgi:hypothetical protein
MTSKITKKSTIYKLLQITFISFNNIHIHTYNTIMQEQQQYYRQNMANWGITSEEETIVARR